MADFASNLTSTATAVAAMATDAVKAAVSTMPQDPDKEPLYLAFGPFRGVIVGLVPMERWLTYNLPTLAIGSYVPFALLNNLEHGPMKLYEITQPEKIFHSIGLVISEAIALALTGILSPMHIKLKWIHILMPFLTAVLTFLDVWMEQAYRLRPSPIFEICLMLMCTVDCLKMVGHALRPMPYLLLAFMSFMAWGFRYQIWKLGQTNPAPGDPIKDIALSIIIEERPRPRRNHGRRNRRSRRQRRNH